MYTHTCIRIYNLLTVLRNLLKERVETTGLQILFHRKDL